jgi:hypothetical protein
MFVLSNTVLTGVYHDAMVVLSTNKSCSGPTGLDAQEDTAVQIAIIGAGNVGKALATRSPAPGTT